MSIAAMLAFNYYFLPPVGQFVIAATRKTGSRWSRSSVHRSWQVSLATRVRREADTAQRQRREIERLYSFSQQLLVEGNVIQLLNAIPNYIVDIFEVGAASLYLSISRNFIVRAAAKPISTKRK